MDSRISALVYHDFVVAVLLKSLDETVSGSDELLVLCGSSCEPSDFTQWHPVVLPTSDENSMETAEHQKMTV